MPNKAQFVEALAKRLDIDKKSATTHVNAVFDLIQESVARGERVALTGFGVFERRERGARMARNPATGAAVRVKKTSVPAFRAGAEFKGFVSGARKVAKKTAAKKATPAKKAPAKRAAVKTTARKSTTAKKAPARKSSR
ncbi:MAG: DNA-binding protein HU-beta [Pseudonocardiales bacterium]|nr:DNA-binding protein HU-beta [Pseudonocardiales bacterium]